MRFPFWQEGHSPGHRQRSDLPLFGNHIWYSLRGVSTMLSINRYKLRFRAVSGKRAMENAL